jgi:hypothetical protein
MENGHDIVVEGAGGPVLTLLAGTVIKQRGHTFWRVGQYNPGALSASSVTFTSAQDDTVGDALGDGATGVGHGQWQQILFYDQTIDGSSGLANCLIRYGGYGADQAVFIQDAEPTISNCMFYRNHNSHFRVHFETSTLSVTGCTFRDHDAAAVYLHPGAVEAVVKPAAGNTFVQNGSDAYNVIKVHDGVITESTTWPVPPTGFTYLMENGHDIVVEGAGGPVLNLLPGTVIKQRGHTFWRVGQYNPGALSADSVTFTSAQDDTVGDALGDGATGVSHGQWQHILFYDQTIDGSSGLTNCLIRYGGYGTDQAVFIQDAEPTISNCLFDRNHNSHLRIHFETSTLSVTDCTFRNHDVAVVHLHPGAVAAVMDPLAGNTFRVNGSGAYNVIKVQDGVVTESTTWPVPPTEFTYLMENGHDIVVEGAGEPVLTLLPGTVIKQRGSTFWRIGRYNPGGLSADSVTFTSAFDDTVGDALGDGSTSGAAGQWQTIMFYASTVTESSGLRFCEIQYGGGNGQQMVYVQGTPIEFRGCIFESSATAGLYIDGSSPGDPVVYKCLFSSNRYGLRSGNNGRPKWRIERSCFVNNTDYGVLVDAITDGLGPIAAINCWWGDASGPGGVGPGSGDAVSDHVTYDPWAVTAICYPLGTGIEDIAQMPTNIEVPPPYPNPFNPSVNIPFGLPSASIVKIRIYNVNGELVKAVMNEPVSEGFHKAVWNGYDDNGIKVSSGIYFCRFETSGFNKTRKLILLK